MDTVLVSQYKDQDGLSSPGYCVHSYNTTRAGHTDSDYICSRITEPSLSSHHLKRDCLKTVRIGLYQGSSTLEIIQPYIYKVVHLIEKDLAAFILTYVCYVCICIYIYMCVCIYMYI